MAGDGRSIIWRPRTSVKLRFAFAQGLFTAFVVGLLAVSLYLPVRSRLVEISDRSYQLLAENLASSLFTPYTEALEENPLNPSDSESWREVRQKVEQFTGQGVRYVLVTNEQGRVVYDTDPGRESLEGTLLQISAADRAKLLSNETVRRSEVRYETDHFVFTAPWLETVNGVSQVRYAVHLGVEQNTVTGEFNRLAQLFLSLSILGVIAGMIAAYLLAARLTKPIISLTESALAIRAGNLNAYADVATNDELEQLSREFQSMVEKLKDFYFQEYQQKERAVADKKRLEKINNRLKELDEQKTDFLNAASHQLRTPLSVIHWSLSLLSEESEQLHLPDSEKELLTESLKSTKRMVDLVNDLLDLSRMEQGRKELTWEKANYGAVSKELVEALQPLAKNKSLELTYQQEGEIADSITDQKAFYQVLNNFVDNSIKYTAQGSVHVRAEQKGQHVEVTVRDTGIGMSKEQRERLFRTRFNRGDEASKMFANGSGLGMFVAHALLKQLQGEVEVDSVEGKGTTFTLKMPILKEAPKETRHEEDAMQFGQAEIAKTKRDADQA